MATSGTTTFNLDIAEAIEEAFERCGRESRTGYDLKTARRSLNLMFAEWANRGINLWTVEQGTTTLVSGTTEYTLIAGMADVLEVVLRRSGSDTELERVSRKEYALIPNKSSSGKPTQFFLDRQATPVITLWPAPENSTDEIVYYYIRRIEDAGVLTNTTDLPWRFYPCMVAGLSYYLSIKKAPERTQMLKALYEEELQRAMDEDRERVPLRLVPGR